MFTHLSVLQSSGSIGRDEIRIMRDVLEDVWQILHSATPGITDASQADSARELLAQFIVKLVSSGELDKIRLRNACLAYMTQTRMDWAVLH